MGAGRGWLVLLLAGAGAACGPVREVIEGPEPTPHERYAESLREAGLADRPLGAAWLAAAGRALREPLAVTLPFRETGLFAGDTVEARGYRIAARRGERVVVELQTAAEGQGTGLFVELFELDPDDPAEPNLLQYGDSVTTEMSHEVDGDGLLTLRLQPELLRTVRYTLTIRIEPTLAFPVDEHDTDAIRSRFGADRDAGRRVHHGVDIFAPRGTPVLAAADGIARAGTNRLGGNVVWQRVPGVGALYYAHLDSQAVGASELVRAGDTVGFVGNSGNAVTTPPHLHFGIYARPGGPVDPFPFLYMPEDEPLPPLEPDVALGGRVRTRGSRTIVRTTPGDDGGPLDTLRTGTVARLVGGAGGWRRVALPDGSSGFVRAADLEPALAAARTRRLDSAGAVRARPDPAALAIAELPPGAEVAVLGAWDDWLLVQPPPGVNRGPAAAGWLQTAAAPGD